MDTARSPCPSIWRRLISSSCASYVWPALSCCSSSAVICSIHFFFSSSIYLRFSLVVYNSIFIYCICSDDLWPICFNLISKSRLALACLPSTSAKRFYSFSIILSRFEMSDWWSYSCLIRTSESDWISFSSLVLSMFSRSFRMFWFCSFIETNCFWSPAICAFERLSYDSSWSLIWEVLLRPMVSLMIS